MYHSKHTFEGLGLPQSVLQGVYYYGFLHPSSIQHEAVTTISQAHNAIIQAKNGTGKTATFILGLLMRLLRPQNPPDMHRTKEIAIILSPTRDLARQTHGVFQGLAKFSGINCHCAIGGYSVAQDISCIQSAQVLCGTPGRALQLIREAPNAFQRVSMLVIDEADRVLDEGFGTQVRIICEFTRKSQAQVVLVSATVPDTLTDVIPEILGDKHRTHLLPQGRVCVEKIMEYQLEVGGVISPHSEHRSASEEAEKFAALCFVFSVFSISQAVVFANRREGAEKLEKEMKIHGFSVTSITSALKQTERDERMQGFLSGRFRILVSTDVSARGVDAAHVNLVLNYDIPLTHEEYVHRIGRGGRFGKSSVAVTLFRPAEAKRLQQITGRESLKEITVKHTSADLGLA